jgi:predicted NAD/FAD-binding protein
MMANIYRSLLREIEAEDFAVLHQRISLTPIRKLWIAMRTNWRGDERRGRIRVGVTRPLEIAVVGAGWAGLAAAVQASAGRSACHALRDGAGRRAGARATSSRMQRSRQRPAPLHRRVRRDAALLREVGVDEKTAFARSPLTLVDAEGRGLRLRHGRAAAAFAWAVAGRRGWSWRERIALLRVASRWRRTGFRALPGETVADLACDLPAAVRREFVEPLCVAALNTPVRPRRAARSSCAFSTTR